MIRYLCRCGHAKEVHGFPPTGTTCGQCDCPTYTAGRTEKTEKTKRRMETE